MLFGKALGNGYAITAVLGRREVMEAAQKTFISSTFWTERIGPTAALATLRVMDEFKSWEIITARGQKITKKWQELGDSLGIPLITSGLYALTSFSIASEDWLKYKTFITQEMLQKGILAGHSVYVCTEHTEEVIDLYFEAFIPVLTKVADFYKGSDDVDKYLKGPVCHGGFKRLN